MFLLNKELVFLFNVLGKRLAESALFLIGAIQNSSFRSGSICYMIDSLTKFSIVTGFPRAFNNYFVEYKIGVK